jgi:hypothetical protein
MKSLSDITLKLLEHCARSDWAGYDPYDALNSRLFRVIPGLNFKWARLILTQGLKRSPVNFRPLLLIPKTHNAKALALFGSALVQLERAGIVRDSAQIGHVIDLLMKGRIPNRAHSCWGYNFDWQTRTRVIPRSCPNIICTTFAANALLDAFEAGGDSRYLEAAASAADFILQTLYQEEGETCWFNYTPVERHQVHNANLLGAALLCRVAGSTGNEKLLPRALRATRFTVSKQTPEGAWYYGEREQPSQKWIDNFHTGFNLCALRNIGRYARTDEFEQALRSGLNYYVRNFFDPDGAPKYFHDSRYPLDVHSVAQSIITLIALKDLDSAHLKLAHKVLDWGVRHMWDERGYFYYQKHRYWTNRIPYLRWGQAWMLLALATMMDHAQRRESSPAMDALQSA